MKLNAKFFDYNNQNVIFLEKEMSKKDLILLNPSSVISNKSPKKLVDEAIEHLIWCENTWYAKNKTISLFCTGFYVDIKLIN